MARRFSLFLLIILGTLLAVTPIAAQDSDSAFPVTIEHEYGSTTIDKAPQRVVALGFTEQDYLLVFGVTPVAVRYWYGDESDAIYPWAEDAVAGNNPPVLNMPYGTLNYEALLALQPDLISAVGAGVTQEEYDLLSQIAPTLVQTGDYIAFGMPWQEATRMIGAALGQSERADEIVTGLEARFAAAREANPAFEGKTVAVAVYYNGRYAIYTAQDSRGRFFEELGFVVPEEIVALAGDSFFADVSMERVDLLDQDIIVLLSTENVTGGREALEADPLFEQLKAVQEGRVLYLDQEVEDALNFSSPLSLPFALDNIVPPLADIFPSAEATDEATEAVACEPGMRAFALTSETMGCIPQDPQRVVVITDSDLDATLALGVEPVGIANGRGQTTPPRYLLDVVPETAEVVGNFVTPSLELVLGLKPDIILAAGLADPAVMEQLNTIAPTVNTYVNGRDWRTHFLTVADALNRTDEAGDFLAGYEARIAALQDELADHMGDEFIVARWSADGPQVMAPTTFVSSVLFDLGLTSPEDIPELQSGHAHSAPLSLEALGVIDVDWAFVGTLQSEGDAVEALSEVLQNPLFQALKVVQDDRLFVIDGSLWTSSGGPLATLRVLDDVEAAMTGAE